jgi:hypothetical protein
VVTSTTTTDVFAIADIYKYNSRSLRYKNNWTWLPNELTYVLTRQSVRPTVIRSDPSRRPHAGAASRLAGVAKSGDMDGTVSALADNHIMGPR